MEKIVMRNNLKEMDGKRVALLVQEASNFTSRIEVRDATRTFNVKSLMSMITFGSSCPEEFTLFAEGKDSESAIKTISRFWEK